MVLEYLKEQKAFRERSNKNKGLANLLMKKYGIEIPMDKRSDIIGDVLLWDRQWRKHLEENSDLRGSDYQEKDKLEKETQLNLGYGY